MRQEGGQARNARQSPARTLLFDLDMEIFFRKRKSLRDKCIEAYGEEFGEIYDSLCMGIPVGGFNATAMILQMIEDVKNNRR